MALHMVDASGPTTQADSGATLREEEPGVTMPFLPQDFLITLGPMKLVKITDKGYQQMLYIVFCGQFYKGLCLTVIHFGVTLPSIIDFYVYPSV